MVNLNFASFVVLGIVVLILILAIVLIIYQSKKDHCSDNCSSCSARSVCPNRK